MAEYIPFSLTEEVARRQNYVERQMGTGFPLIAMGYKGGVLLITKSTRVRKKIAPITEGVAFGGVGNYFHLRLVRRGLKNLTRKPGILNNNHRAERMLEQDDGLTDIIGSSYNSFDLMPYEVDVILAENNDGQRFYRVDYMGNPYQRERFIVCGGVDRDKNDAPRKSVEQRVLASSPDFSTLSLDDAAKISVDALNLTLNHGEDEVLHAGILEGQRFRHPTREELERFHQFVKR